VYSTEARGYSVSGATAVYSTLLFRKFTSKSSNMTNGYRLIGYSLLSIAGFLSHLSYVTVFAGQFLLGTIQFARHKRILLFVALFAPTILFVAFWWLIDLRFVQSGGGPVSSLLIVGLEAMALPMGAARPEWLVAISAGILLFGLVIGIMHCYSHDWPDAALFALYLVLSPVLVFVLRSDGLLYSRHFYVVWMPLISLLGIAIALASNRSNGLSWLRVAFPLLVWFVVNGMEYVPFNVYGRGGFSNAVDFLIEETKKDYARNPRVYWIGSDHDFRNQLVLRFYLSRRHIETHLDYANQSNWPKDGVDWLILHEIDRDYEPAAHFDAYQHHYELVRFEPYSAPVGWHWAIYRRQD
jgi:hypothetical protein